MNRPVLAILIAVIAGRSSSEPPGFLTRETLESLTHIASVEITRAKGMLASHGIKVVYLEGLASGDVEGYRSLATRLKNWKEPEGDDTMSEFLRQKSRSRAP